MRGIGWQIKDIQVTLLPLLQMPENFIGLMYRCIIQHQEGGLAKGMAKSFQLLKDELPINSFGGSRTPELIGTADTSKAVEAHPADGQGGYRDLFCFALPGIGTIAC